MATSNNLPTLPLPVNLRVQGNVTIDGDKPETPRASLAQDNFAIYPLAVEAWRVHDAYQTPLGSAASDDLGITTGTYGTGLPYITTGDVKNDTTQRYARLLFTLPPEYVAGESVRVAFDAGMITTVASSDALLDVEAFKSDRDTTAGGSDLVTTAAQSINSLTFARKVFDLTASGLSPGDVLDLRINLAVTDSATATAVIGALAAVELHLDIKG